MTAPRRALRSLLLACAVVLAPSAAPRASETGPAGPDASVKIRELLALQGKGPQALPALREALHHPLEEVRAAAIQLLGKEAGPAAVPDVAPLLQDTDPDVAVAAVDALFAVGNEEAIAALRKAFDSPSDRVRVNVAASAGDRRERRLVPEIGRMMSDPFAAARGTAVEALRAIGGPETFPFLMAATGDANPDVVSSAIRALEAMGDRRALDRIQRLVTAENPGVRAASARAIWMLGGYESHGAAIETLLGDASPKVRASVLYAMRATPADQAFELIEKLQDPDPATRKLVVGALKTNPSPRAVPLLARFLADPDEGIRRDAIHALGTRRAREYLDRITALKSDPSETVRMSVASALGDLGGPEGLPTLRILSRDTATDVRSFAAIAAGQIGGKASLPVLTPLLTDADPSVRLEALRAVGHIEEPQAVALLRRAARDPHLAVRLAAIQQLGARRDRKSIPLLRQMLKEPAEAVRVAARTALDAIGSEAPTSPKK